MFDRFRLGALGLICLVLPFTGCSSSTEIDSIQVTPTTLSFGGVGLTAQLTATGIVGHGSHPSSSVDVTNQATWSTASKDVATVSSSGLVTSVGAGVIEITASMKGFGGVISGSSTVTVTVASTGGGGGSTNTDVTSLSIIPSSQSVASPNQQIQFVAIGTYASGATANLTNSSGIAWTSSSSSVAKIGTNTGLATAVSQGTTTITAIYTNTSDNSVATGTVTLTVTGATTQEITSLTIIPGSQTVTLPLTPAAAPTVFFAAIGANGSSGLQTNETNSVGWVSSNTAVAIINPTTGAVTPQAQGTTTITAQFTNLATTTTPLNVVTATATLTVSGVASEPLLSIAVLPATQSVSYPGQTSQLIATGTFSQAPITQNLNTSTTYPLTWISSNPAVATVCTPANAATNTAALCPATPGLVTAVGQGTAAITAIATNPDKSVVTGVATFTVTNGVAEQITALSIVPSSLSLSATSQPGQFVALGTSGTTGLIEDVTNSPQLAWTSSIPTYATISTYPAANPGQALGLSTGTTNITAEYTNTAATAITPATVVTATAAVSVTNTPAAEPLLSITVSPATVTTLNLDGTAQFLAFGSFSTAPTVLDVTDGFYHAGFPNSACTAAFAAADTAAAQAGTAIPNSQCSFNVVTWSSLPFPFEFPISSAGAPGALGGLATADASGSADVYAVATNSDGTVVYGVPGGGGTATFNCPYAPPTYGTITVTNPNGTTTTTTDFNDLLNPGTCNTLTIADSLLSTLTVFNASAGSTGLNQANWLITAPSATGTPNVIHCGGSTEQATLGGSVCEATYPNGTSVTLTAPAEPGVNFGGWSSNCKNQGAVTAAGPNSCTVVVGGGCVLNPNTGTQVCGNDSNVSVGAVFN